MTTHCTFCDLIHGAAEVSICHEDSDAIAFMDIQPVNMGHILVVPRVHYESLLDVPQELGMHLFRVTMRLAGAVRHVTGCEDLNIVVNSGAAAGQDEPHYHVHIIPRRHGDGFDIPLPFGGSEMPDRTLLDAMAARMIAALRDPMRTDGEGHGGGERETRRERATDRENQPVQEPRRTVERARAVPLFADAPPPVARSADAPRETMPRGAEPHNAFEGAHGELRYSDE